MDLTIRYRGGINASYKVQGWLVYREYDMGAINSGE